MQNSRKQDDRNQAEIANNIYPIKQVGQKMDAMDKGFSKIPHWMFNLGLDPYEQAVYLTIIRYTIGFRRDYAQIALSTLVKSSHVSKSSALRAINKLEELGLLIIERSTSNGEKNANTYIVIDKNDSFINFDVVSERHHLVSVGHLGSVCGTLGVVSVGHLGSVCGTHNKVNIKKNKKEKLKDIITATAQTDETTPTESQPELLPTASQPADSAASKAVTVKPKSPKQPAPTTPVWNAYVSAYQQRYGVEPIRGARVNSQLSTLVKTVGQDKATQLASYYLTHNKPIYANSRHSIDWLLRDCAALHTDMMTGTQSGSASGYQASTNSMANAFNRDNTQWLNELMDEMREGN